MMTENQNANSTINSSSSDEPMPATRDTDSVLDAEAVLIEPTPLASSKDDSRRWWIKLFLQPALFLVCGALILVCLGVSQKLGWISAGDSSSNISGAVGTAVSYICPMMCTPPQSEPGRCPVCAMELVPATQSGGGSNYVEIDSAARRIANIRTAKVTASQMSRSIKAIGEISYDEGTLKTLSAYVDGRLERLYADYTGVVVQEGDHLAWVYSPKLYSAQVELLLAKRAMERSHSSTLDRIAQSNKELYASSRQRLLEMGMTEEQVTDLEESGEANSRMHLCAPISGTVINKLAVEGQYVNEGQPIYELADLSTVWLMLEMFPEDASVVRYGQKVEATVQSLPTRNFEGRVAFIDPNVDPETRTVGVRVVMPNTDGLLRTGDFAKASIRVSLSADPTRNATVYDPDLANKWISPRHPHVVSSTPGTCPICGIDLVPSSQFGFSADQGDDGRSLVVPRDAVLMAAGQSVVYVETKPGRFEIRNVLIGPTCGDQIVIRTGLSEGDVVATEGNFLIDSQMQLAGNPSLIDPMKAQPSTDFEMTEEMIAALSELSDEDRVLAEAQRICPVTEMPLGSMGPPPKVDLDGQAFFICCKGCEERLRNDPEQYLANLMKAHSGDDEEARAIREALAQLSDDDRQIAEQQGLCPVADYPLGAMGVPIKVDVLGTPVFICCEGCRGRLLKNPDEYLAKLEDASTREQSDDSGVPPIGVPQLIEEPSLSPPIGDIQLIDESIDGDEMVPDASTLESHDRKEATR